MVAVPATSVASSLGRPTCMASPTPGKVDYSNYFPVTPENGQQLAPNSPHQLSVDGRPMDVQWSPPALVASAGSSAAPQAEAGLNKNDNHFLSIYIIDELDEDRKRDVQFVCVCVIISLEGAGD